MVSAIVLCRGDVNIRQCRACVNNVAQKLVHSCPNKKEAFGGYDECMLQYSGRSILGTTSNLPLLYMWDDAFASKPEEFNQELKKLMDVLRGVAAYGDPLRKYATGRAIDRNYQTIYALVQCTPDLSPQDCYDCLTNAYGAMATCPCNGNRGSRQIGSRCNFRYERACFFN
ncbi:cysteine-rich repeat secretory protein 38-like [Lycium ferocissimum]|uniref:cysteine-rich repeat secretory protein 38-like n=1 Tax=Lycium ferocissimum TaxID=112874 RepID=UPI00281532F3|nr:cysteine-rich repeat secretory protein 38-like [Lycium ferocissimum]